MIMRNCYLNFKALNVWICFVCLLLFQTTVLAQNGSSVSEKLTNYREHLTQKSKYPVSEALSFKKRPGYSGTVSHRVNVPVLRAAEGKYAYCFLLTEDGFPADGGIASISVSDPSLMEMIYPSDLEVTSGAYADGKVYLQTYFDIYPVSLVAKDDATGKETVIAEYGEDDPIFLDMTYDQTTNTLYAVGGQYYAEAIALYSIDMETGDYTELFYLYSNMLTVAADNDGNLFGIDDMGSLCEINVDEQYSVEIGYTGEWPMYVQSMTFDPEDNTLYWAGFTSEYASFFATVDTQTAELNYLSYVLGNNAEVAALYFRSDPTAMIKPEAPKNFEVTPASEGALSATLSWTNPSCCINGDPLASLERIDIYRNGELIRSLDEVAVGEQCSVSDDVPESGLYNYTLVPFNENGEGKSTEAAAVYVGRDVPGYVSDLSVNVDSGNYVVDLTWGVPVAGGHGGWFDSAGLRYDVIRFPDNVVMASDITSTQFTDRTIEETSGYSYGIVASNVDGRGDTLRSETYVVGPALEIPFRNAFATEAERSLWKIEDTNGDGCTWHYGSNYAGTDDWYLEYYCETSLAADDWFFSAPIRFEAGKRYVLSYDVRLGATLSQEKFRVVLCDGMSSENQVQEIDDRTDFYSNFTLENASVAFVPSESGSYSLGFQCYSGVNQYFVQIANVEVREVADVDLGCDKVYGLKVAATSEPLPYEVYVTNYGASEVDGFGVEVVDEANNVVGSVNVQGYTLGLNETVIVPVTCELVEAKSSAVLTARVVAEGDTKSDNDQAVISGVEVLSGKDYSMVQVGDITDSKTSAYVPFDLSRRYSSSQILYTKDMLGFGKCKIERLGLYYSVSCWSHAKDLSVKIYMMNTDMSIMSGNWQSEDDFTMVYDGKISFDENNNTCVLTLGKPFDYSGENLCMLFVTEGGCEEYYYNFIYSSSISGVVSSLSYSDDNAAFDFSQEGMTSESYADIMFVLSGTGSGISAPEADSSDITLSVVGDDMFVKGQYERMTVYSVDGSVQLETSYRPVVNVAGLSEGVYVVLLDCGTGTVTKKVVITD